MLALQQFPTNTQTVLRLLVPTLVQFPLEVLTRILLFDGSPPSFQNFQIITGVFLLSEISQSVTAQLGGVTAGGIISDDYIH
jgi:hypothetical protein